MAPLFTIFSNLLLSLVIRTPSLPGLNSRMRKKESLRLMLYKTAFVRTFDLIFKKISSCSYFLVCSEHDLHICGTKIETQFQRIVFVKHN